MLSAVFLLELGKHQMVLAYVNFDCLSLTPKSRKSHFEPIWDSRTRVSLDTQ